VEAAFQLEKWPSVRVRLLFLYFFTIAAYIFSAYSDFYDLGPGADLNKMFFARAGVCFFGVVAFILLLANKVSLKIQYVMMGLCMFTFMLVESTELVMKYSVIGSLSVPTTVFMVLAYYILLPPRALPSLCAALSGSVLYLFSLTHVVPVTSGTFINSTIYFFLANGFGIFFLSTFGTSLRREYTARCDLKKLVEYDDLTGAYSRRKVLEAGNTLFKSSRRFNTKLSVLMMDIDHFKRVNDDFGHSVGDRVLKETAKRCSDVLREVDFFGRLGGEEFVIVLPQSSLHQASKVAERLRTRVSELDFTVDGKALPVSVSIGVSELRAHDDFLDLLRDADEQLYRAKESGRNQVCPVQFRVLNCGA